MEKRSAFLVIFQATINGKTAQTDVSTIKDPMNSRQVRRDCEFIARKAFEVLAKKEGVFFAGTDKIKCVECVEFRHDDAGGTAH
jgi:hypothetical protein